MKIFVRVFLSGRVFYMKAFLVNLKKALLDLLARVWKRVQEEPVILKTAFLGLLGAGYLEFLSDDQVTQVENIITIAVMVLTALSLRGDVKPLPPTERTKLLKGELFRRSNDGRKN